MQTLELKYEAEKSMGTATVSTTCTEGDWMLQINTQFPKRFNKHLQQVKSLNFLHFSGSKTVTIYIYFFKDSHRTVQCSKGQKKKANTYKIESLNCIFQGMNLSGCCCSIPLCFTQLGHQAFFLTLQVLLL